MKDLVTALETTRPREKSGSWTSARYDFQRHIAILKIIELHEQGHDYRIILDYFDDLVILNNSSAPTRMRFFQLKTRVSGSWKMRDITAQSKTGVPPRSIIGKMYLNAYQFPEMTDRVTFASNATFRFELACGRMTSDDDFFIHATSLSTKEQSLIDGALEPDFPRPRSPDCCSILSFERLTLSVHDQERDVLGRLCQHFALHHGDELVPTMAVYRSLFSEVSKRSGISHNFESIRDFYIRKTISRSEVDELFNRAYGARRFDAVWPILQRDLAEAGYTSFQQIAIKTHCIEYIGDRARGAPLAARFRARARQLAVSMKSTLARCESVIAAALALKVALPENSDEGYDELQALAALMVEAYEAPHD